MRAPGEETTIRNLYHKKLSFKRFPYNKKLVLNKFSSIGRPPADILPPNKSDYSYVISTQNLDFLQSHVKEVIVGSLLGDGGVVPEGHHTPPTEWCGLLRKPYPPYGDV